MLGGIIKLLFQNLFQSVVCYLNRIINFRFFLHIHCNLKKKFLSSSYFYFHNYRFYILERRLDQCPDRALLVWSPTTDIPDQKCKYQLFYLFDFL